MEKDDGTNTKKKSNIEKKIVRDPERKNRMAQKSQKKKIPRSISKSPLAIYNKPVSRSDSFSAESLCVSLLSRLVSPKDWEVESGISIR